MKIPRRTTPILIAVLSAFMLSVLPGCVYYNTFYNARKAFNEAERVRKEALKKSGRARGGRSGSGQYNIAIEKSLKVIEQYPNSSWYDDALYVLATSYFHTEQYGKAERRFRELLANYGESDYVNDAMLMLAQSKLRLDEEEDAMQIFQDIFNRDFKRDLKAEAALALGYFHYEQGNYEQSRGYLRAVRDSLGTSEQKRGAQALIGDSYFDNYQFGDALGAYLQVLGMDPNRDQKYHALYNAAISSYRLLRIDDGLAYLDELANDEVYFDSLGTIKLTMAEGYEMEEELELAEVTYLDVANSVSTREQVAQAYYRLGLIYQYDYDELQQAKDYYDKAVEANRGSEPGSLALQKSSDIGKLEQYRKSYEQALQSNGDSLLTVPTTEVDSLAMEEISDLEKLEEFNRKRQADSIAAVERIDEFAYTQYLLGELYWFQLNKPDSAIIALEDMHELYPESYYTPRGLVALAEMYRDYHGDTARADSILRVVLKNYPHSDFKPMALDALGLRGTAADTGYAEIYVHRAEDFLLQGEHYDSAIYYFNYVADSFPNSRYAVQARFNALYVQEEYLLPGDSSLIFAYQKIVDSFPGTEWASLASRRLTGQPAQQPELPRDDRGETVDDRDLAERGVDTLRIDEPEELGTYGQVQQSIYLRPNGDSVILFDGKPTRVEEEFEFPVEASSMRDDYMDLVYQILLDFSGRVVDYELKVPSQWDELNERANRTVASMWFDPTEISQKLSLVDVPEDPGGQGHWFVYKYRVEKPDYLR